MNEIIIPFYPNPNPNPNPNPTHFISRLGQLISPWAIYLRNLFLKLMPVKVSTEYKPASHSRCPLSRVISIFECFFFTLATSVFFLNITTTPLYHAVHPMRRVQLRPSIFNFQFSILEICDGFCSCCYRNVILYYYCGDR